MPKKREIIEEIFPYWEKEIEAWESAEEHESFTIKELRAAEDILKSGRAENGGYRK